MIEIIEPTTNAKRCTGFLDEFHIQCALEHEHFGDHVGACEDASIAWPSLDTVTSAADDATFEAMSDDEVDAVLEAYGMTPDEMVLMKQRTEVYVRSMCLAQREIKALKSALFEAMRTIWETAAMWPAVENDTLEYWESLVK